VKDENGDYLQIPTFWIGERITSLSYGMYIVSTMLGRQIPTAELLVPDPSPFEVAKLKRYKSPGSDQIPAKLIQAGGEILYYVLRFIRWLILFGIRKNCLISGRSLLSYQFTSRVIKLSSN
jgi:hypothetical protein